MCRWKFCGILIFISLAGCQTHTITQTILEPQLVYPDLPPVPVVPKPQFYPVKFILPKDHTGVVLSVSNCVEKALSKQEKPICGTNSTNIFIGLDQDDYINLLLNLQIMRNFANESTQRINQINAERAQWQNLNKTKPLGK